MDPEVTKEKLHCKSLEGNRAKCVLPELAKAGFTCDWGSHKIIDLHASANTEENCFITS